MNILFLTIGRIENVEDRSIYLDLLRTFRDQGHIVYCVSPNERRTGRETSYTEESGLHVLRVKIGNIKKCNIIEKGLSTVLIESQYKAAVQKYLSDVKFDIVLYSTPPITLAGVIQYVKKRDGAKSYLMLKDIFPQNAVDIGMMSKKGVKGFIYRYFRKKEKQLYAISDKIGCMSQANCEYVLRNNPEIAADKVEICPNAVDVVDMRILDAEKERIRAKYGIPNDRKVFVYGGNLGRPQGIPFLIDCLKSQTENPQAYFLIVGAGTEYGKIAVWIEEEKPKNVRLIKSLPKEDYDQLVAGCDVGMVFLDHRFTIPNFPSRILSYMQAGLPILACTDPNTDVGRVITEGGFGWWCESNDAEVFSRTVQEICRDTEPRGTRAFAYLEENYSTEKVYRIISVSVER